MEGTWSLTVLRGGLWGLEKRCPRRPERPIFFEVSPYPWNQDLAPAPQGHSSLLPTVPMFNLHSESHPLPGYRSHSKE